MTDEVKLKNCPFCGNSELEVLPVFNEYGVRCDCGCEKFGDYEENAIEAWNTRAEPDVEAVINGMQDAVNDYVMDCNAMPDCFSVYRGKLTVDFINSSFGRKLAKAAIQAMTKEGV